jgi:hypothetical protein
MASRGSPTNPTITSSDPPAGPPGCIIAINGTLFDTSGNVVHFGAGAATILDESTTLIHCTIPA